MTRYTVIWDPDLEAHLIAAWVNSDSETRALLTEIANWVDVNLAFDPHSKGQADPESLRTLSVPISGARVSVTFLVLPEERQVRVVRLVFRR